MAPQKGNKWSHLTTNLTSTTPGYLHEIYHGEAYEVTTGPLYGHIEPPSAKVIKKASSPLTLDTRGEKSWWERAKTTSKLTCIVGFIAFCIFFAFVVGVPAALATRTAKRKGGRPSPVPHPPEETNDQLMSALDLPMEPTILPRGHSVDGKIPNTALFSPQGFVTVTTLQG
ncbi:hypothetical protein N7466_010364 [Penicillium verhagenii]|uniref:uncharacterized protein n=1 Tax=Penicillium verhagenii TaxID=1562060 RepID=UPI0025453639|nr:uncharacterized protein N7466_010364 [Penicillium verhagenii]KAJ5919421.1 hypothetical protein N7466_010364 [Penicillium verhagenii]